MNVFYEESGSFKVGSIVSKSDASYQVDTQHGKRAKIKAANVFLEFEGPLDAFLSETEALAADIDLDFLWECCGSEEFGYEALACDYWGHTPSARESAAIILRLAGAPMYFYKKGKGRFKAAPEEALKAALAGLERKQREQEQVNAWAEALSSGQLPAPVGTHLMEILFKPDKNSLEFKAFEQACKSSGLPPLRLADRVGGIRSVPEYLLAGFLLEHFPRGTGFHYGEQPLPVDGDALPLSDARAFSIDDAATTEIDDALSLATLANGNQRVGIHIAAPTLGISPGSELERIVFSRLSTVYFPGDKITMLPDEIVQSFTLLQGKACPALSLYVEVTPAFEPVAFESRIERVKIAANLRHAELEKLFNEDTLLNDPGVDYDFKHELTWLWHFANALERRRGKYDPTRVQPLDYTFAIEDGKVRITPRRRGSPMDKLVSELMILANSEWGRMLGEADIPGLYRAQSMGKVRMTTRPEPHIGLGVAQYAWATSPLRRAADFVNQRQLLAMVRGESAPYQHNDPMLFSILRDFDTAYSAYLGFQDRMEHFWCLRWFNQEGISELTATYLKEDLVRVDGVPMRLRVGGLPELPAGARIRLAIARIDELMQEIECRYLGRVEDDAAPAADLAAGEPGGQR
jgi:exoribonuclease-2